MFKITIDDAKQVAYVYTPYMKEFVSRLKSEIGGCVWESEEKRWKVPVSSIDQVRTIMTECYGRNDISEAEPMYHITLHFRSTVSEELAPYTLFGKSICIAGKDGVAKPGTDVVFKKGTPKCGGSRNYWKSIVSEGSCVELSRVPESAYKAGLSKALSDNVKVSERKFIAPQVEDELIKEKQRLLERIKEIDNLLSQS